MRTRQTIVEVFSPYYVNPSVIQLCIVMAHRYNQVVSVNQPHWPYRHGLNILVDVDHLGLVRSSL